MITKLFFLLLTSSQSQDLSTSANYDGGNLDGGELIEHIDRSALNFFSDTILPDSVDWNYPMDEFPQFPGGEDSLHRYIRNHLKYPDAEKKARIEGMVIVSFVVEKDGSITEIKIARPVPGGPGLSEEALSLCREMPAFISPAKRYGKPMALSLRLPIKFDLP